MYDKGEKMRTAVIDWAWRFAVSYAAVVAVRKWREKADMERTRKYEEERERQLRKYDIYRED